MTRKLILTIALGTALAVIAAGTASSLATDVGDGIQAQIPSADPLPQCSDLKDNDKDGKIDLADPQCAGPLDNNESSNKPGGGKGDSQGGGQGGGKQGSGKGDGGKLGPGLPGAGKKKKTGKAPSKGIIGTKGPGSKNAPNVGAGEREKIEKPKLRKPDGSPTKGNPGLTIAKFGAAPIGVPNFVIDQFEIPPFLLPIYQACGTEYSIPWQVLASINRIETAFGTNLNVSTAGAVGWMQFIPSSWRTYGVDANNDGRKDPYNPVDAICAAARYLRAAGGDHDLRKAIFAYNHADWYVDEVLLYANQYAKLPDDLIGSITGLTEGAHFPVAANARYADDISERAALKRSKTNRTAPGNAADVISNSPTRRGINIYSRVNAPVVAVNDGVIKKLGRSEKLGRYVVLEDAYGNRYTYAQLGSVSKVHPVLKQKALGSKDFKLVTPGKDPAPTEAASAGANQDSGQSPSAKPKKAKRSPKPKKAKRSPINTEELRQRLFALPQRPANVDRADVTGQLDALLGKSVPGYETFKSYFSGVFQYDRRTMELQPLRIGSQVTGGTVLGRIGKSSAGAPHLNFSIRPAGRGAPKIDPKPILDGWKLLETTAIYRASGKNPFSSNATVGQVLLMSKSALERRVLADPRLEIYSCGRTDIRTGGIDRRILAAMEYLAERGYRLTITSLHCGHSYLTSSGNVSAHSYGAAMDIAEVNGIPILGNQGPGTITEAVIRDLMQLQGTMRPAQIISLMDLGPPTFALPDHDDHIHVGYTFTTTGKPLEQFSQILKPEQWQRLIERLGQIENPKVPAKPSKFSLPDGKRASGAHRGE
jgi:hypothetical protein